MKTKTSNNKFAAAQKVIEKKADKARAVDQQELLQRVRASLEKDGHFLTMYQILKVIQAEQQVCADLLAQGRKIIKWNYMTLYPSIKAGRKLKCPKNGITYDIKPSVKIVCRIGEKLRKAVQKVAENASPVDKKLSEAARKGAERRRLYVDRFVKEDASAGDKAAGAEGAKA